MTVSVRKRASAASEASTVLYQELVTQIRSMIEHGSLRPGDRVPSIRELRQQSKRSVSTVLRAYQILEGQGLIEARPQSGYYVRATPRTGGTTVQTSTPPRGPQAVAVLDRLTQINRSMCDASLVPLGGAHPGPTMLPTKALSKLERLLGRVALRGNDWYEPPAGGTELRRSIARHYVSAGCTLSPDDIVVTCGAQEALILTLQAVAKPGDVVAVESPAYFGVLQALEALGMRALELPTHPTLGLDLDALESTLKRRKPAALVVCPNGHNPLGYVTPDAQKRRLVELVQQYELPMIEDDVYGDLSHAPHRPITCQSLDSSGLIILCSSFSKSLAPGMRIGWCAPGRWREQVERLKFCTTITSPTLSQQVIAAFIDSGAYARHLRKVTRIYEEHTRRAVSAVHDAFPDGTSVTTPSGGFVIWVQLPQSIDADRMYDSALRAGISIAPGPIFSPSGRFQHHIRLSIGNGWNDRTSAAIRRLGEIAGKMIA